MSFFKEYAVIVLAITAVWTLALLYVIFLHPFKIGSNEEKSPLLRRCDILHELPRKGFLWIMIGVALSGLLIWLKFPGVASKWAAHWITSEQSVLLLILAIALVTTFLTEVVSNTVVLTSMFVALFPLTRSNPAISWQILLTISLASNCAFMSPLATPCNGLGFGSSHKISLRFMLVAGLIMNLLSAAAITLWVHYIVPFALSLFA
jgi:sodium-dependent dicarboxylate transporter 2/3/5